MPRIRIIPATILTATALLAVKLADISLGPNGLIAQVQAEQSGGETPKGATQAKPGDAPKPVDNATAGADAAAQLAATNAADKKAADAAAAEKKAAEKKAEGEKKPDEKKSEDKKAEPAKDEKDKKDEGKKDEGKKDEGKGEDKDKKKNPAVSDTPPPDPVDHRYTTVEVELLQNLEKRREELDHWETNVQIKESALDATEKRIDDKIAQIEAMRKEVSALLALYNEKEDAKLRSLVKIYENMKPGDAARIFNEVEMPILLMVIDKMSEKKAAPILAQMDPKKAKQVTVELAEQRRLGAKLASASAAIPAPISTPTPPAASPSPSPAPAPSSSPAPTPTPSASPSPTPAATKPGSP